MKKLLFVLFLLCSIDLMAFPHHVYHHHVYHHHHKTSQPIHYTSVKQNKSVKIVRRSRPTKVINTFHKNGILYFIILHPKRGHVYNNDLIICEGCGKFLVKKNIKYCSKCRAKKTN